MYAGSGFADPELVATAALLHDIGRSQSHGLDHAQIGALILRKMGISEDIAGIVERHIGGGLSADECSLLGLLPRDCIPRSSEEKIVCHADNIVKGRKMITIEERLQLAIHLPKKVRRRMYRLAREVELFR